MSYTSWPNPHIIISLCYSICSIKAITWPFPIKRSNMKILFSLYCFIAITSFVLCGDENAPVIQSTVNVDSDPDDNIIEVDEVYAVDFKCDVGAVSGFARARNVDEMGPKDVGVVGAIGDSMTAALFAKVKSILDVKLSKYKMEYRGVSWNMGGDPRVTTLPNLIRHYNENLKGFSVGAEQEGTPNAGYNFAVSGAVASGLLEQAKLLVARIKADNLDDEWKVITVFIGGNDLCAICNDEVKFSPDNFYNHIKVAIEKLAELKNVFINLVQTVEITKVSKLSENFGCTIMQALINLLGKCDCLKKEIVQVKHKEYKEKINELETFFQIEKGDRNDFVVVVQPFFGITNLPEVDPKSYFAIDCFHLSQKGHLDAAVALWNNMLQPVGSKTMEFQVNQPVLCPQVGHPYFYTHKNSATLFGNGQITESTVEGKGALSTGQVAGIAIGVLLVVAASVGVVTIGVLGYYLKYRKPKFSEYTSLDKKIRF